MTGHTVRKGPEGWRVKVDLGDPREYPDFAEDPLEAWRCWRADAAVEFTDALKDVCEQAAEEARKEMKHDPHT